jgi:tetratricopeptide (TPR) repeat protein
MIGKLACAILALTMFIRADEPTDKLIAKGIGEFSAAFRVWDGEKFGNSAETFRLAGEMDPKSAAPLYWRGTALFHQMLHLSHPTAGKPDARAVGAASDGAIRAFESALALDPDHAESHALLGTLYGMKIKGGMVAAIRYGPRVQDHRKQALKCGATNPRVRYLLGAGQLHTAKGDAGHREALNTLLAAEKLFSHEAKRAPKPLAARWGYSSCLAFIGKTYEVMGKRDEALTYYRKTLAMHPADHAAADGIKRLTDK